MNDAAPATTDPIQPFAETGEGSGPWVLLWSQSQNALHMEKFTEMLSHNRQAYAADRHMDYVPIFSGERWECQSIANSIRNTLLGRQGERGAISSQRINSLH